ncbi:MAG TPA: hypothetical protein VF480_03020, partial [Verrucomicrobiae bacterium]
PTRLQFSALNPVDFGLTGVSVIAVPEPSSCALPLVAFTAAVLFSRRKDVKAAKYEERLNSRLHILPGGWQFFHKQS